MLFEISEQNYNVLIELRYGSLNNFTQQTIYTSSKCFLHEATKKPFEKAIELAAQQNLKLKIFDAFRPQKAQERLWEICPNDMYVTPPHKGSPHSRGVAIDLTLVTPDGKELDMGTEFDDFSEKSHHGSYMKSHIAANRYQLLGIMMSAGWDFYQNEWWHYQLFKAREFDLITHDYGMMS